MRASPYDVSSFGLEPVAIETPAGKAAYVAAQRLWSTRAAVLSGLVLATMPFWCMLSRQAITDMLYVGPASSALLLIAAAVFDDDESARQRARRIPRWMTAFFAFCLLPQLWEIGRTIELLNRVAALGSERATPVSMRIS